MAPAVSPAACAAPRVARSGGAPRGSAAAAPAHALAPSARRSAAALPTPRVRALRHTTVRVAHAARNASTRATRCVAAASASATGAVSSDDLSSVFSAALLQATAGVAALALAAAVTHPWGRPLACASFGAAVGAQGLRSGSLSPSGAVAAALVGWATLSAGFPFAALLLSFFLTSSKLTSYGAARKAAIEGEYKARCAALRTHAEHAR